MPVKNAGSYLKPCLDSILAQTYTNWELIAVNDGSMDGSDDVLNEYSARYTQIITVDSIACGIVAALQTAFSLSTGDRVHRMDADDLMPPNKLEWMSQALENGSVVTGKVSYFSDEREIGEGFLRYTMWLNELMETGDFWRDAYRECPIPSSAWLMYRVDFERIGGFAVSQVPEDYDLAFRVMEHDLGVIRLTDVVHHWRDSDSRTSRNQKEYFPIAYLPLKVEYFLKLHRDKNKKLVLWGAGNKGKMVTKLLIERDVNFNWITNNSKKIGKDIYGVVIENSNDLDLLNCQTILAVSSPDEQLVIQDNLEQMKMVNNVDYFWFF